MPVFFHTPCNVPFLLLVLQFVPFIVLSFSSGKSKFHFCQSPVVEVYLQRHESKAPLGEFGGDLFDLGLVQEQFSLSQRLVIVARRLRILGDRAADKPAFVIDYTGVGTLQVALTVAKRLDLRAQQDDACLDLLYEFKVVVSLLVRDAWTRGLFLLVRLLCHLGHNNMPGGFCNQPSAVIMQKPRCLPV